MNLISDDSRRIRFTNSPIAAQQIEEKQIWDLCAIGKAASLHPEDAALANLPVKLGEEPRLTDPRFADDPNHLPAAVLGLPQEAAQNRKLVFAIDKSRLARRCRFT
jgi:hypothetical protein